MNYIEVYFVYNILFYWCRLYLLKHRDVKLFLLAVYLTITDFNLNIICLKKIQLYT